MLEELKMDSCKIESKADFNTCMESEISSISETSSEDQNSRNRGGREARNRMRLRSFRLSRLPSLRSCVRPMKLPSNRCPSSFSDYSASSEQSSPNYTKATSRSDARMERFQKSARNSTRLSSFKPMKHLCRMSSMKLGRPLTRKSSGGTELKKRLKRERSIKPASIGSKKQSTRKHNTEYDQPSIILSSDANTIARYSEMHYQASSSHSESSFSSKDQNKKKSKVARPHSDSSVRAFRRTATLRPQRILTKTVSLKSRRSTMNKSSEVSEISGSRVDKATCSSTLKESKFPYHLELQTGGYESLGISAMKVCSYSYCSLHGHRHGAVPPLKRFVSMRRCSLKTPKGMKPELHSVPKAKHPKNRRKGTQLSQIIFSGYPTKTAQYNRQTSSVTGYVLEAKLKGANSHGEENTNTQDSANLTDIVLGETPKPGPSHKTSDSLKAKRHEVAAFSAFKETSEECCSFTTEAVKLIPEASDAVRNKEKTVAPSTQNENDKPVITVDHHKITDSSSPELRDSEQSNNLSSKLDYAVSTGHEEVLEDAKVHKGVNGDTAAHLNLEVFKVNPELSKEVPEASTTTTVISEEKTEDSKPNNDYLEGLSPSGDSTQNYAADQSQENNMGKEKYKGLWGLIYQHMVSGITAEVEMELPLNGRDKGKQAKDKCPTPQMDNSVSSLSSSVAHKDISIEDHDAGDHKLELWQSDAIKLVQEAFDKILQEIPDQSSDKQSLTSDTTSEQELLENNQCEDGLSISIYFDSTKESIEQHPGKMQLEAVNINTSEEEKAAAKVGHKSGQQISKSWSNLRRVIILKRFVKALEMVNKINPQKPRILPTNLVPMTEKINLRHQTVDERKIADEWMLDYALRQVISKLAPAQKRKVALLVQAFETVTPPSEISTNLRSNATASPPEPPVQVCTDFSIQKCEQNNSRLLHEPFKFEATTDQVSKFSTSELHIPGSCSELKERSLGCGSSDTAVDPLASENSQTDLKVGETLAFNLVHEDSIFIDNFPGFSDLSSTNSEEPRSSGKPSEPDDSKSTSDKEFLINGNICQEVPKKVPLIYDSEFPDHEIKFNSSKLETGNATDEQLCQPESLSPENYVETTAVSSAISSAHSSELSEEPRACKEEAKTMHEILQKSSPLEDSEPSSTIYMAQESKLEKQKYMKLWYLIYEHMVSGTEAGEQPFLEAAQEEEHESEVDALLGMKHADSSKDFPELNQKSTDNQNRSSQKIERHKIEAIKIIEEAIDEIPLPDIQDDSPVNPTITGNMPPEEGVQKKHSEDGELFISTSNNSAKESFRESNTKMENNTMESRLDSTNITCPDASEMFLKLDSKSKPIQKSWNLKKVILLQRFIKSLEKARKFNPREPQYLPLEPDTSTEKVNLRHRNMEDQKNAQEWMLDHALQQVVAKLTPARRRKVELLVEAFETVTPILEVKGGQRHREGPSPHSRLIHV